MILQFGTGAFLRGFLDWMLYERGAEEHLVVSGLTRSRSAAALHQAQGRFTHVIRGLQGGETLDRSFENDVIDEVVDPYSDWERLREIARDPELRWIVTNATEAGMVWEPASTPNPAPDPASAKLAALLVHRFHQLEDAPVLWITPTELVEDNGPLLRDLVLRHAAEWGTDESFEAWLDERVRFVSTLVDRIVAKGEGLDLESEPYHLWVIEGELPPPMEGLPVTVAPDLAPWRERKVRLLNGGHGTLVFTGLLLGHEHVIDAMRDPVQRAFSERTLREEVLPTLEGEPAELEAYLGGVLERFENPFLAHRLDAILLNSHAKVQARLLPAMRESTQPPVGLATSLAAFLLVYRGRDEGELLDRYRSASPAELLSDLDASHAELVLERMERLEADVASALQQ